MPSMTASSTVKRRPSAFRSREYGKCRPAGYRETPGSGEQETSAGKHLATRTQRSDGYGTLEQVTQQERNGSGTHSRAEVAAGEDGQPGHPHGVDDRTRRQHAGGQHHDRRSSR